MVLMLNELEKAIFPVLSIVLIHDLIYAGGGGGGGGDFQQKQFSFCETE